MNKKIICIIQARTSSTRLKNKILLNIDEEQRINIIDSVIARVKQSKYTNKIILAIPDTKEDEILVDVAKNNNIAVVKGPLNNVLERFFLAAKDEECDYIIRITSDCPFIDFNILDKLIEFHSNNDFRYSTNCLERTYPHGYDAEIFNKDYLIEAYNNATKDYEKEHVTPYMYLDKEVGILKDSQDNSNIRITVDCEEDYQLIKLVYKLLSPNGSFFTLEDVVNLYKENNWLYLINNNVFQKKINLTKSEKENLIRDFLLKTDLKLYDLEEYINENK